MPAPHAMQLNAPVLDWCWPLGHVAQLEAPADPLYEPEAQAVQPEAPLALYWPLAQRLVTADRPVVAQ